MRIGVLTHNYPRFGGDFSGVFIEALCTELARQGDEVIVWAPDDPSYTRSEPSTVTLRRYRYAWPRRLQQLGYMRSMQSDMTLRLRNYALSPLLFAAAIWHVYWDARRTRPAILHAHWLLPNGFIAAVVGRLLRIPVVISVPGSDAQVAAANPLFRAMARFALDQAALLTANSAELRDAVLPLGADPARFDLILYGTNPDALQPSSAGVDALRRRWLDALHWRAAQEPLFVLCVGRMVHKKGFDVLLHALATPTLAKRPVVAIMVGNGDEKAAWQEVARVLGISHRVHWAGTVPINEISTWYNAADLLAMPSISKPADGLNVCVLDAMACGKPVVASTVAGNSLAVVHGETGFLVPERDAAALADAIGVLADNPYLRARFGAAGRARLVRDLGWPPLAQRYRAHFARLAEKY
jgi:glycosyltransferase involved in cell wall biosynthesis